ncbi:MAG: glutathione synthase, partial [Acidimicrobiia bacterium]
MRLAFIVNDVATEEAGYTTTRLGVSAVNRGFEVWVIGVGDLAYDADERVKARARRVPKKRYTTGQAYLK